MNNYAYKKIIKPASNYLLLATIIKYLTRQVVDFSQHFKPKVLINNMLTTVNYPILVLVSIMLLTSCTEIKPTLNIAVASNFESTLKEIIKHYPNKQYEVNIIAGSSGVLTNQILNSAPYDLFLSADTDKPNLIFEQLHLKTKPQVYAIGKLALWLPNSTGNNCIQQLTSIDSTIGTTIKTLAIANPKTAPYGKAAKIILDKNNITVEKIIQTSNASQAYIYTKDGLTQAGFMPYSMVMNETSGCLQVFESLELDQSMILLSDKAKGFYEFMKRIEVKKLIKSFGYLD